MLGTKDECVESIIQVSDTRGNASGRSSLW